VPVLVPPLSVTTTLTGPVNDDDSAGFVQVRLRPPVATETPVHACPLTVTVAPVHAKSRATCADDTAKGAIDQNGKWCL